MAADEALFVAQSATGPGRALWITDGTASGTRQIQVANASPTGLNPANLAVSATGTLFFEGFDSAGKANLWTSDGTDAGTQELEVPGAPASGLSPQSIVPFGGGVAFSGKIALTSSYSYGLWFSNGTAAGTTHLTLLGTNGDSLYTSSLTPFAGKLYFSGTRSLTGPGPELWVSDGTAAGTQSLQVPGSSPYGLAPSSIVSIGTKLVLNGISRADLGVRGLWVSDGTGAGTVELHVAGLNPSTSLNGVDGLFAFGAKAAFVAEDTAKHEGLWVTDGTAAGTQELPGATVGTWGAPMATLSGGRLAFIASDSSGMTGVWVTDGTAAGTQELHPAGAGNDLSPNGLIALDGRVLFDGLDASGASRLWTSDGTSTGTSVLLSGPITVQGGETSISAEIPKPTPTPAPTPTPTPTPTQALTPQQAFVTVLYEGLLGRAPGQTDVQSWTNLIDAGTPETAIAQAFLSSGEYQPISDNRFVTSLYQGFLGRTPGPTEALGWTTALMDGASQAQVATGFAQSAEAHQRFAAQIAGEGPASAFVTTLYQGLLGRTPAPTEVQGWANVLAGGQSQASVAQGFLSSAEYRSIGNSYFVESLYQGMLGRTPGSAEVQGWTSALAGGASRAQVVMGFAQSPEAQQHWASITGPTSS